MQDGADYKALHQDALKELEAARAEASEHRNMLREDAAKAREDANAGRAEAARMRNEAAYERERCQRLQEQLSDSLKQVDGLTQSNTKYQVRLSAPCTLLCKHYGVGQEYAVPVSHSMQDASHAVQRLLCSGITPRRWRYLQRALPRDLSVCAQVLVNDLQQKLSTLDAESLAARDKARQMEAKASSLESEKALLVTAEQRQASMIGELSTEKHRLLAQSQVEQKVWLPQTLKVPKCML